MNSSTSSCLASLLPALYTMLKKKIALLIVLMVLMLYGPVYAQEQTGEITTTVVSEDGSAETFPGDLDITSLLHAPPHTWGNQNFIQVINSGYAAEYGRSAGGSLCVITLTGRDEFQRQAVSSVTGIHPVYALSPPRHNHAFLPGCDEYGSYPEDRCTRNAPAFGPGGSRVKDRLWFFQGNATFTSIFHHYYGLPFILVSIHVI